MTAQTLEGFLLTRHWRDNGTGVDLEFWFTTDEGPLHVRIHGERSVFFLPEQAVARARALLAGEPGVEFRPVALRDFHMAEVVGVYFPGYRQARRSADRLLEAGLEPLEADINPADRYLMERFIAGGARLHGEVTPRGRHLQLDNPALKPSDYRPRLRL